MTPTPWAARWNWPMPPSRRSCRCRGDGAEFGGGEADLDQAKSTCVRGLYRLFAAYRRATADFAEVLAALLPCMWGYSELGRALAAAGLPAEPRYRHWIKTYAGQQLKPPWPRVRGLLDRAADGLLAAAWPPASAPS